MATTGWLGYYVETRDYAATAALWASLGFEAVFETDHASGQWAHPNGGPYVFIAEQHDGPLETHPILGVASAPNFTPTQLPLYAKEFTPEHWGVAEALIVDPDDRHISLQAPLLDEDEAPDADAHHEAVYSDPVPEPLERDE
jgi:hypothetical protein